MKVMVIHHGDEAGQALVDRVSHFDVEVVEQAPRWPAYFHAIHQPRTPGEFHRPSKEQPQAVIIEASTDPSVGREVAGYLGETAFTRHIPVFLVDHPENEAHRAKRRAPDAKVVTASQLDRELQAMLREAK